MRAGSRSIMGNPIIQIIFLAGVALVLIVKLRSLLGTREGFEQPPDFSVPGVDQSSTSFAEQRFQDEIAKHVDPESATSQALLNMNRTDSSFSLDEFLAGAETAYGMILVAFAEGNLDDVTGFLSDDVRASFEDALSERSHEDRVYSAKFIGVESRKIKDAVFDDTLKDGEITVEFVGELVSFASDADGQVVEGDDKAVRKQRDIWTFARNFELVDPNWTLEATTS